MIDTNEREVVTCMYCAQYAMRHVMEDYYFPKANEGICKLYNKEIYGTDAICDNFKIKSGYYTPKWYPGKEE